MNTAPTIPDAIRTFREKGALSQQRLGALLGVSQATISLWESGVTTPRGPALLLLKQLVPDMPVQLQ